MYILGTIALIASVPNVLGNDQTFNELMPLIRKSPANRHEAVGLLREEYAAKPGHRHSRFMTTAELMDPLESRKIDEIATNKDLVDEVNYLRSYAVEECRELVCSAQGKRRFADCANSITSVDKKCLPGCQDHLNMWVLHRCYMIETFDCAGNIGPNSVDPQKSVFNQAGPQTFTQFEESMTNLFVSKGVDCKCCSDVSDVILTRSSSSVPINLWTSVVIAALALIVV